MPSPPHAGSGGFQTGRRHRDAGPRLTSHRSSEWRDGIFNAATLEFVQAARRQLGQHMLGEEIALVEMRVAAEDEGSNAQVHVAVEFGEHLTRIADDGTGAAASGEANTAPEMRFDVEIGALGAELVLSENTGTLAVLGTCFDLGSFGGIELRDEAIRSGACFDFGFSHDDMRAKTEVDLTVIGGGFFGHDAHDFGDAILRLRPHKEDIAMLRAQILRSG